MKITADTKLRRALDRLAKHQRARRADKIAAGDARLEIAEALDGDKETP